MFENVRPVPGFKERWKQIPLRDRILIIAVSPIVILTLPGLSLGLKIEKRYVSWGKWRRRLVGYGSAIPIAAVAALLSHLLPPGGQSLGDMWPMFVMLFVWMPVILPLLAGPIVWKEVDADSNH